jgi:uncharacterized protein YgiM (DUF1202 family)
MKEFFSRPKLCFYAAIIFIASCSPSCSQGSMQDEKAVIVSERLKLRSSTAQAARVVGELKGGDEVTVTDRETAEDGEIWSKVKGPGGDSGWIKSLSLVKQEIVEKSRQIAGEIKDIPRLTAAMTRTWRQHCLREPCSKSSGANANRVRRLLKAKAKRKTIQTAMSGTTIGIKCG